MDPTQNHSRKPTLSLTSTLRWTLHRRTSSSPNRTTPHRRIIPFATGPSTSPNLLLRHTERRPFQWCAPEQPMASGCGRRGDPSAGASPLSNQGAIRALVSSFQVKEMCFQVMETCFELKETSFQLQETCFQLKEACFQLKEACFQLK